MGRVVIDASALVAFLFAEPSGEAVATRLPGTLASTLSLSEVIAYAFTRGKPLDAVLTGLQRLPVEAVPFDLPLAALAATFKPLTRHLGLSLADRACLAVGLDRGLPVLTGDRAWAGTDLGVRVELFR